MTKTFKIYRDGKWVDTLGPHWFLQTAAEATAKYRALHPEIDPLKIEARG